MELEAGIPMITSPKVGEYTIASEPIAGMEVVGDSSGRARSAWAIDTFIW